MRRLSQGPAKISCFTENPGELKTQNYVLLTQYLILRSKTRRLLEIIIHFCKVDIDSLTLQISLNE